MIPLLKCRPTRWQRWRRKLLPIFKLDDKNSSTSSLKKECKPNNDQINVANRILRACGQANEIYLSTKDLANIL